MAALVCWAGCSSESGLADRLSAYGWESYVGDGVGLWVSIERQELVLVENGRAVKRYVCSTAKNGPGNVQDSGQTPLGWHKIGAKIGDGLPVGAVLKERRWTGQVWTDGEESPEDLILSRVLWLAGLEPGKNSGGKVDSWNRYIYIHGTNDTASLGQPASAGCVRMDPQEVIDLYDHVSVGCCVLITEK